MTHRAVGARRLALATLAALALAGCGAKHDVTREHLATYLKRVDTVERTLTGPLQTIDSVDQQLTKQASAGRGRRGSRKGHRPSSRAQARRLREAQAQIVMAAARLRAISTPAQANHLRALLLELVDRQAALTQQTVRLIAFAPAFSAGLRPLGVAVSRLEHTLSVTHANGVAAVNAVYRNKVVALHAFVGTLAGIQHGLARLVPPSSSRPTFEAERRALRQMAGAATSLAAALAVHRTTGLRPILLRFDRAAQLTGTRPAQKAEIAAVKVYDRQVTSLGRLVQAADRERVRLAKKYP